jgi:enamine deaminase RidA (YjgF/YER057c/UK114 family)
VNDEGAMESLQPSGWPQPRGYANGIVAEGRIVFVAGQIGWNARGEFETDDFVGQVRQALRNVVAVLAEAGAAPERIARMTWYITDKAAYRASLREVGRVYREVIGTHYPAMTLVQVAALLEDRAKVEIEATAVLPTHA